MRRGLSQELRLDSRGGRARPRPDAVTSLSAEECGPAHIEAHAEAPCPSRGGGVPLACARWPRVLALRAVSVWVRYADSLFGGTKGGICMDEVRPARGGHPAVRGAQRSTGAAHRSSGPSQRSASSMVHPLRSA